MKRTRNDTVRVCTAGSFRKLPLILSLLLLLATTGCSRNKSGSGQPSAMDSTLVIAMLGDADYLNPVLSGSLTSANINGLIYPSLLQGEFDTETGLINYRALDRQLYPTKSSGKGKLPKGALAKTWTMSPDNRTITYVLRDDAYWNDGKPVVSGDFKYSYLQYGNPVIASVRQQYLAELIGADKGKIDFDKAIETPDPHTLVFHFYKPVPEHLALSHTSLTPLPAHIWSKVSPDRFRNSPLNGKPLGAGPYHLDKWNPQQELVLASSSRSNLPKPGDIPRISFRIVPDYTVRLAQLQTGAVDVVENIKPEDFKSLQQANRNVEIKTVGMRVYDYVGWSNIDHQTYHRTGKVLPHPLFGSQNVRLALTHAIDREAIIDGYLGKYGTICNTDISPSLKWAWDKSITPHAFDPAKATELLRQAGWKPGPDGILQKNGRRFSFTLYTNSGNARRNYASVIIQQNLRAIGIDCKLDVQESNVFFANLRQRKLDAWLAGWAIGLEIDPLDTWGSDLEKSRFNFTGYQNPRLDELCELAKTKMEPTGARSYWIEYQKLLHRDQPVTFLYWMEETQGFSKRIKGEELNISGTFYNIDDWKLSPASNFAP